MSGNRVLVPTWSSNVQKMRINHQIIKLGMPYSIMDRTIQWTNIMDRTMGGNANVYPILRPKCDQAKTPAVYDAIQIWELNGQLETLKPLGRSGVDCHMFAPVATFISVIIYHILYEQLYEGCDFLQKCGMPGCLKFWLFKMGS